MTLPVGTQVVLRVPTADTDGRRVQRGATGRVVGDDGGRYRVELADGRNVDCPRSDVRLRRDWQRDVALGPAGTDGHDLVRRRTVYAAVVGSRGFGLDEEGSDTDLRGVYVAPTHAFWSLVKPPPHVEGPGPEQFSWEVERCCELALKANPNLLEVLHSPLVVQCSPVGEELVALRSAFLSQLAYSTYSGYVISQFRKLQADLRRDGVPRWKHVMHLLRLLLSATDLLATGRPLVDVSAHRERLLAVRRGEVPWDEVERWRLALHADLDRALVRSPLPAAPDVERVDAWLVDLRRRDLTGAAGGQHES